VIVLANMFDMALLWVILVESFKLVSLNFCCLKEMLLSKPLLCSVCGGGEAKIFLSVKFIH